MADPAVAQRSRAGLVYALSAYGLWGLFPIYWRLLKAVPATEILANRVLWSFVFFLLGVWGLGRREALLRCLSRRSDLLRLALSSALICANWGVYIYAVNSGQILESSFGYFINPIVNVLLGLLFLRERLSGLRWLAVGIALVGIVQLGAGTQRFPWIALALALTFGFYALVRKRLNADALVGMTIETMLAAPLAGLFIAYRLRSGSVVVTPGSGELAALLVLGGLVTAVPLFWFAEATLRLPLATLGFCQYLSPSLQFLCAVLVFSEPFPTSKARGFVAIWVALAIYSWDLWREFRLAKSSK
jgi:chloramphenicol-sensitive protein RarD